MNDLMDTNEIYSLVRKRLGRDAPAEMIESVSSRVAAILATDSSSNDRDAMITNDQPSRMILTATGLDKANAAEDIMAQLQSYKCAILGADRATADGYFSLLVSFDMSACSLSFEELSAALDVAAAVDSLEICLKKAPDKP